MDPNPDSCVTREPALAAGPAIDAQNDARCDHTTETSLLQLLGLTNSLVGLGIYRHSRARIAGAE
eukprot:3860321-Rhodomonas_salina.2